MEDDYLQYSNIQLLNNVARQNSIQHLKREYDKICATQGVSLTLQCHMTQAEAWPLLLRLLYLAKSSTKREVKQHADK